jgi:hypothetical protein
MNRGIYSAASAMNAAQTRVEAITANLANSGAVGFKRKGVVTHSFQNALNQAGLQTNGCHYTTADDFYIGEATWHGRHVGLASPVMPADDGRGARKDCLVERWTVPWVDGHVPPGLHFVLASVPGKLYREFLEMLDDRQGQGATLITSQFPVNQWHEIIADPTVADAILDRLVHNAYRIELKGESMRKGKTPPSDQEN